MGWKKETLYLDPLWVWVMTVLDMMVPIMNNKQ